MRIHHTHVDAGSRLTGVLDRSLFYCMHDRELIVVCIGTDRSTGDALGPLVGSRLVDAKFPFPVYGTIDHPVHANNILSTIDWIEKKHPNSFIIAVDACLGMLDSVGVIQIEKGPLLPGKGVEKDLPAIGDISIMGIVNVAGFMEHIVLQYTRLALVMRMAKIIADAIRGVTVQPISEVACTVDMF